MQAVTVGRVVDVEESVLAETRMKSDAQQALLAAAVDPVVNVQKGVRQNFATIDDAYAPGLFDHEQVPAAVAGVGDVDRVFEAARDFAESDIRNRCVDRRLPAGRRGRRWQGDGQQKNQK